MPKGLKGFQKGNREWDNPNVCKNQFKKQMVPWNKGLKGYLAGDKHYEWKGDKVGYGGLHNWVYKQLGQPDICEFCGRNGLAGLQIHWANKSGKYKRNLEDWLRLCAKCHRKYDGERRKKVFA